MFITKTRQVKSTNLKRDIFLYVDLPTFPKATLGLGAAQIAAYLKDDFDFVYHNCDLESGINTIFTELTPQLVGFRVSSQNFHIACELSKTIKTLSPKSIVVWGGEFPTLLPESCRDFADVVVSGMFDSVSNEFVNDYKKSSLKSEYYGENTGYGERYRSPDLNVYKSLIAFNKFMGYPIETSRGCTEVCTFCMVHTMQQKHYHFKPLDIIQKEVFSVGNNFINIIDYNFGVSKDHVISVCKLIENSAAIGFMAEMCIEFLDDEEVLTALQKARCKMIYCGLESIDETALKAVHKMNTNHISNYKRIITKAKKFGVNIASGFILGIDGTNSKTFYNALDFFNECGLAYIKLTYLTYNPGTKAKKYYEKKGRFLSEDPSVFDGNHLSYLPNGVDAKVVQDGTKFMIRKIYGLKSILKRSSKCGNDIIDVVAYVLFNYCYSQAYQKWISKNMIDSDDGFDMELRKDYQTGVIMQVAQTILISIWRTKVGRR